MDQKKENRERLWESLEMAVVRRDLIIYGVAWIIFDVIFCLNPEGYVRNVMMVVIAALMLPFVGFYLWRTYQIFRSPEEYIFCRCKLSTPHQRYFAKGMMYFTVVIEDPEGGRFPVETHAIFSSHGFIEPLLESYINSTVTVAYNRETEMVVVG